VPNVSRACTIRTVFVDGGYAGKLIGWAQGMFGWTVSVVKRTEAHRFVVLPKRWIVERTFAWPDGLGVYPKTTNCDQTPLKP
jgi:transposase